MDTKNNPALSPAFAEYTAWKERRLASLPTFEQWIARRAARMTDERIARRLARIQETQDRQMREAKARFDAQRAALAALKSAKA